MTVPLTKKEHELRSKIEGFRPDRILGLFVSTTCYNKVMTEDSDGEIV